jgi:predicted flavoprotein YhiN
MQKAIMDATESRPVRGALGQIQDQAAMMLPSIPRQQFEEELAAKEESRAVQRLINKLANEKTIEVLKKQHQVNQTAGAKRLAEQLQAQRKSR